MIHHAKRVPVTRVAATQQGFTLLEVLVASALTAVAGAIAYAFINSAMTAYTDQSVHARRLDEINLFFSVLSRDLTHAVNRPIEDENNQMQPALFGGEQAEYLISFTRGGWPNPRELPRSSLQRVAYTYIEEDIERITWFALDRVESDAFNKSVVLQGVEEVTFRYLDPKDINASGDDLTNSWQDSWPDQQTLANVQQSGAGQAQASNTPLAGPDMPAAVEITLRLQGLGEIIRVFALTVGSD